LHAERGIRNADTRRAGASREAEISAPGVGPKTHGTEKPLKTQTPEAFEEAKMADRETKERKLIALMVNDLGPGFGKKEMANLQEEVSALSDPDLDETLAGRLDLPHSAGEEALAQAISHVDERSGGDQESFTGAPDMSHEPRPEEREG
jgi:hypothetical protein